MIRERIKMERDVPEEIITEWQSIVNIVAQIMDVPVGLIMRVTENDIEVFVSSHNENNPYEVGAKEHLQGSGLYCETVIKTQSKLLVPNALESAQWRNNPDVKLNMISYLGFPINWPDNKPFGTICVLDSKPNNYSSEYELLLEKFRDFIEKYLEVLEVNAELKILSENDPLTGVLNRRGFFYKLEIELERAIRYKRNLSLLILDVDNLKQINDCYGHQAGDNVLKELTITVNSSLRLGDVFGRIGGDEFMIMLPETSIDAAQAFINRIRAQVENIKIPHKQEDITFTISIGASEIFYSDTVETIYKRADQALNQAKKSKHNRN